MSNATNKMRWDLESIFPGGSSSVEFTDFRRALAADLKTAADTFETLPQPLAITNVAAWADYFLLMQDIVERLDHAHGFAGCLSAQDVTDEKALTIEDELTGFAAEWRKLMTGIEAVAADADDAVWAGLIKDSRIAPTEFYWNETRRQARLKMEPRLEKLALDLSVNGYHAWNRLYNKIAGDLKADFEENGTTISLSMGQLANRFSSPNRDLRRQAFETLEATWGSVDSLSAMALNYQAGFRLSLYQNRGWKSAAFEPLLMNRLKQETLDAMWDAVTRGGREMRRYIDAKKKLLGIDTFRWYDQVAPLGATQKTYSYEDAGDFVVEHLGSFSKEMGDFARRVIDNRWIEAEDRSGKAAGGFCTGLDLMQESRIFMTYSGNYEELMTLAHEIGHAYHSFVLWNKPYFAREYPMNLAETASTFNELLVTDAAMAACDDDAEKLVLLDHKIQEGFIMFCNLHARYLFDVSFYKERAGGMVPKERLNELMVAAQKQAYGDILGDDGYHPLFWASKLHFFETEMPFYNFPYTFGYLFSGGIYDLARKEGAGFAAKYRSLLADTGSMTTEEVASRHLGTDLTKPGFWNDAVDRVLSDIDPFIALAKK